MIVHILINTTMSHEFLIKKINEPNETLRCQKRQIRNASLSVIAW